MRFHVTPPDIVEELMERWLTAPAVGERKFYDKCKTEIEVLREEVQLWKNRFFAERQDHEATMKAWDEERSGM